MRLLNTAGCITAFVLKNGLSHWSFCWGDASLSHAVLGDVFNSVRFEVITAVLLNISHFLAVLFIHVIAGISLETADSPP